MSTDDFEGNSALTPQEQLDSDEIRNADGDEVVDPPERWIEAKEGETLDDRLADEVPDVSPEDVDVRDADAAGDTELASADQLDRLDPETHGRDRGQIDGSPEDGESFFQVES
jgi:hypothetical protein